MTLALDDFGTDYSSLGYLTQLPFDKLKIDRIFIDGIAKSERARKLLQGIIALGRGLNMTIVAEGAEKPGELEILRGFNCDIVQGYVFARPTPAAAALAFARDLDVAGAERLLFREIRSWRGCRTALGGGLNWSSGSAPAIAAGDCRAASPGAPRTPAFSTGRPNGGRTATARSPRTLPP